MSTGNDQIRFLQTLDSMIDSMRGLADFNNEDFNPRDVLDQDTECDLYYSFILLFQLEDDDNILKMEAIRLGKFLGIRFK